MQVTRSSEGPAGRFVALDGLRGIAALTVVLYHIGIFFKFPNGMILHGNIAVDFFLCLSGFVLAVAHDRRFREGGGELRRFLASRIVRLWPTVLAGSVVALFAALSMPGAVAPSSAIQAFLFSIVVLPRIDGQSLIWFNGVYWSLFAEIVVNLLWALSAKAATTRRLLAIAILLSIAMTWVAISRQSVHFFYQSVDMIVPTTIRAMVSFFIGVLAHRVYAARLVRANVAPLILIAALLFPMIVPGGSAWFRIPLSLLYIIVANPVIVLLGAVSRHEGSGVLTWLGDISFPLYAMHLPIIVLLAPLVSTSSLTNKMAGAVGIVVVVLIVAEIVSRFFDKPVRGYLRTRLLPPPRRVATG